MSIIAPTPAANSASGGSLFGGLFKTGQGSAGGIFGMLLSLFGQNAQTAQLGELTAPDAKALTGLMAQAGLKAPLHLLQQAGQTAQAEANLAAAGETGETSLPSSVDLLSLLQSLAQQPEASPELKTLLDGADDVNALQAKIATLDDEQQQSLLGELAALLMPPPAQPVLEPVQDSTDDAGSIAATTDALAPAPSNAEDRANRSALEALNRMVRTQAKETQASDAQDVSTADATQSERQTHAEAALAKAVLTDDQSKAADSVKTGLRASAQTNADQDSANRTELASTQMALSTAAPKQAAPQTAPTQTSTTKAEATQAIGDVKSAPVGHAAARQSGNMNAQGEGTGQGEQQPQTTTETAQSASTDSTAVTQASKSASFAEHVTKASLSRTGANVPVSEQIAVQMSHALKDGQSQMTIKLHPADLGRIDIKIDVNSEGRMTASFSVDQPATLDLLTKDQRGLERSLADAGLKTDSGTLSFNLRNDNGSQQQSANTNTQQGNSDGQQGRLSPDVMDSDDKAPAGLIEMVWHMSPDRVDVRI